MVVSPRDVNEAISAAIADDSKWKYSALDMVKFYPKSEFLTEDVRNWAYDLGLPKPVSCRAWGAVIINAQKIGIVEHVGYRNVSNEKAHKTPASVWSKL